MLFVCDFDGTISTRDTIDQLLENFADPSWEKLEEAWLDGKISAVECMSKQIDMVDTDLLTLENFFRNVELDKSFILFYNYVKKFAKIVIASDGLDHSIKVATRQYNFPEVTTYANGLTYKKRGIKITFPLKDEECKNGNGVCKCAVANYNASKVGGPIILVGDGKSDACIALHADIVFAKHSLTKHCEKHGLKYYAYETFADVLKIVKGWVKEGKLEPVKA